MALIYNQILYCGSKLISLLELLFAANHECILPGLLFVSLTFECLHRIVELS